MNSRDRKRNRGQLGHGGGPPSADSIEFVGERRRNPGPISSTEKRIKLEDKDDRRLQSGSIHVVPRLPPGRLIPSATAEALSEIRSIAETSERAVGQLKEQNEEWKEGVILGLQKANSNDATNINSRMQKFENKAGNFMNERRYDMDEIERKCLSKLNVHIETRLKDITEQVLDMVRGRAGGSETDTLPSANFKRELILGSSARSIAPTVLEYAHERTASGSSSLYQNVLSESQDVPSLSRTSDTPHAGSAGGTIVGTTNEACTELQISTLNYTMATKITTKGYQEMIRHIEFTDVDKLEALTKVDDDRQLRDYTLFHENHQLLVIEYILRIGGSAYSIMNQPPHPRVVYKHHPDLEHKELDRLRIFELLISDSLLSREECKRFEEWKSKNKVPRYVYELGALFIRRNFKSSLREEVNSTTFSLVMDVARVERPIWVINRPGWNASSRRAPRNKKDSTLPFNGMDGALMACISKDGRNFKVDSGARASVAFEDYDAAKIVIDETACVEPVEIHAKAADLGAMLRVIGKSH